MQILNCIPSEVSKRSNTFDRQRMSFGLPVMDTIREVHEDSL